MDIEEQKNKFLKLLRESYYAQKTLSDENKLYIVTPSQVKAENEKEVFVKEKILEQYGFSGTDFWEIICPSLKQEGVIAYFRDPNIISKEDEYYEQYEEYKKLKKEIMELNEEIPSSYSFAKFFRPELRAKNSPLVEPEKSRVAFIEEEMEKKEKRLRMIRELLDSNYPHKFLITEKLLKSPTAEEKNRRQEKNKDSSVEKINSIYLVSDSRTAQNTIFLVINEEYGKPFRYEAKIKDKETSIKKLWNIAYPATVSGAGVKYSKLLSDNINSGIFKKRPLAEYLKKNGLKKISLVQKSKDENTLVLKTQIKLGLSCDDVPGFIRIPNEYRYLYVDSSS